MKKRILITVIVMFSFLIYVIYWTFFDINRLPKGDLISESQSPNGTYTIKSYLINGGATTSYAIRGELNYNNAKKNPENIYWNYREDKAVVDWVDDDTVTINGHKLDVPKDKFDFRKYK